MILALTDSASQTGPSNAETLSAILSRQSFFLCTVIADDASSSSKRAFS